MPDSPDFLRGHELSSVTTMGAYIHIPFCALRCGYCDFNTYTKTDWLHGASLADYPTTLTREIKLSTHYFENLPRIDTVFFGGGTPTMLNPHALGDILDALKTTFPVSDSAEITVEANPESVAREDIDALAHRGFTRLSFGMQSAVPSVLATLDRRHTPGHVKRVVQWAHDAHLDVSVDLIYGTPGESDADWERSVQAAIDLDVEHLSAYALTIEDGTKMGAQVRQGKLPMPSPDVQARRYEIADDMLSAAGYHWYEISNWARTGHECRHNMTYWRNGNWWGYGPGAHSHLDGLRFWNVKHPQVYGKAIHSGRLPIEAGEKLSLIERNEENIMLAIRLREGLNVAIEESRREEQDACLSRLGNDGLIEWETDGIQAHIVLTRRGRLLADRVIAALWEYF